MKLKRILRWSAGAIFLALVATALIAYWLSDNACDDRSTAAPQYPMKAIVYCDYGSADVLRLEEIEKPTPGANQLLVKVHAAAVNPLDWHFVRGTPYVMRLQAGLRKPKVIQLGVDFAGTVEAVGRSVTRFKPGDDVFGGRTGAFAEYLCVREDRAVVLKPANLTFEQAAAVPIAAVTALQGLRDKGKVQPGQKVLINGASGGVGTFAVQIAKSLGADVTGVCSTGNVDLVRSIGADHVVDYTREDFTRGSHRYDFILDNVGNHSSSDTRSALTPNGTLGGHGDGRWIGSMVANGCDSQPRSRRAPSRMSLCTRKWADSAAGRRIMASGPGAMKSWSDSKPDTSKTRPKATRSITPARPSMCWLEAWMAARPGRTSTAVSCRTWSTTQWRSRPIRRIVCS